MEGCPQKMGICIRVGTTKPKKPNSAIRKIAKVRLPTGYNIRAVIPGSGFSLVEYNSVWVQAGRARDIPGIHYRLIRGKGDLNPPTSFQRQNRRSKFSVPNWTYLAKDENNKVIFIANRSRKLRNMFEEEYHMPLTRTKNKYYVSRALRHRENFL